MVCKLHVLRPANARYHPPMAALGTAAPAVDGSSAAHEHELRVLYEIIHTVNSTLDLEQVLGGDRAARQRRDRRARDLHLPERGPRTADRAARGLRALRAPQRPGLDGRGRGHRRLGAAERAAGLHPREGARRPAHQVLPRARGGEVPVARVGAADRQGPARDRRDRAACRGAARVQLAGRGLPAPRAPRSWPTRSRTRASTSARGARCASSSSSRSSVRSHRARRVARRPARRSRSSRRSVCSGPSRCASTCSSRAATGCACARPRPARRTGPTSSRCRSSSGELQRTQASGGTLTSVLAGTLWGAADDALGARRAARRGRRGDGLPGRAPGRRPARAASTRATSPTRSRRRRRSASSACSSSSAWPSATSSRTSSTRSRPGAAARRSAPRRGASASMRPAPVVVAWALPARARPARRSAAFLAAAEAFEAAALRDIPARARRPRRGCAAPARARARRRVRARAHRGASRRACPDALAVGISDVCSGPDACAAGFAEAQQAARALPVLRPRARHLRYDELGVYKYLLRVPPGERVRDKHADALRVLAEHDAPAQRAAPAHARGVPAPARARGRDGAGALRPPQHAAPAAAAHRGAHRPRRARRRLAAARGGAQAPTARGGLSSGHHTWMTDSRERSARRRGRTTWQQ